MGFTVLGPVALVINDDRHTVARAQSRGLLALLLLEADRAVSLPAIIEALWGGAAPPTAKSQVQMAVHAIRRTLVAAGSTASLDSGSFGYRLVVDADDVDLGRFERLVARAQRAADGGDAAAAADLLREGLALWRGEPLADASGAFVDAARARLTDRRLAAVADLADIELRLGRHEALIDDLAALVDAYPMREAIRARLMLALYRGGRQVEALQSFRDYRQLLADEEGIEPGPELTELQVAILRGDARLAGPPAPVPAAAPAPAPEAAVPAQLPADVSGFTGRREHLRQLDEAMARVAGRPAAVVITAVMGTAGVGKTALAVHWAHANRGLFPDGQLSLDLRGFAPGSAPLRPLDALARLLDALGVRPERVPDDADQAASLYRTVTAERRLLVLLDNARDADQVRPLLPGGPGCLVIVTSRDHLAGLVARDGAARVAVDVLGPEEAHCLLATLLGADRVTAEPAATVELARLCSYLPLALRIAAANVIVRGYDTIDSYVTSLRDRDRVGELDIPGDPHAGVRAAFDLSYEALPPATRRLFRLLSLVPGAEVDAAAAAALLGSSVPAASALFDDLVRSHLVQRVGPDRFGCHDLLRRYAAERAEREDPADERAAAAARLYDHYLRHTSAAAAVLYPQTVRLPEPEDQADPPVRFAGEPAASAWLAAESANLAAIITHTAQEGPGEVAWRLADGLRGYYWLTMRTVDWLRTARTALAAAEAAGDVMAQAAARLSLCHMYGVRGQIPDAIREGQAALALSQASGWLPGETNATSYVGIGLWQSGEPEAAIAHFVHGLELCRKLGNGTLEAVLVGNLGGAYAELGQLHRALEQHTHALALAREMGSRTAEAVSLVHVSHTLRDMGEPAQAREHVAQALAIHREIGSRHGEASALRCLAEVALDTGDFDTARRLANQAIALARETNNGRQLPIAICALADLDRATGAPARAVELAEEALGLARHTNDPPVEAYVLIALANAHADLGDHEAARTRAELAVAVGEAGRYQSLAARARTVLGRARLLAGAADEAAGHAREAAAVLAECGHRVGEAEAHELLGDAVDGAGRVAARREALRLFEAAGSYQASRLRALLEGR
ncbi:AfsR/SARP family transcriptional regulator [Luedemannella helvata]|uniref:BTAD domain-containing putative transcriptional regulator n=1 Tax=Luedemannella helvata TaxID=349315 RepID=A0ABP4VVK4_9ACTN